MNIIRLSFYWSQVIAAVLLTFGLGILPFVRCIVGQYCIIHSLCFLPLIIIGLTLLRLSINELREALKSDKV